jgi:hypothetical protein
MYGTIAAAACKFPVSSHGPHQAKNWTYKFEKQTEEEFCINYSCLIYLSRARKLILLDSSILWNYKQLLFVGGKSGVAALIIGVQAIGHITAVINTELQKVCHLVR